MPALTLPLIYEPIRKDLELFQLKLTRALRSEDPLLGPIERYLRGVPGKFIRPALALLICRLLNAKTAKAIDLAVSLELVHTATLIHDDIMDGASLRRGHLTVLAKWGTDLSIISGDYLYAKSFAILSGLDKRPINQVFAECAGSMCQGQAQQIRTRGKTDLNRASYLQIIKKKTATLFSAACAGAAILAEAEPSVVCELADYGTNLGMAFQIADDCLDVAGKTPLLGKTAGSDFLKKDMTLPVIEHLSLIDARQGKSFLQLWRTRTSASLKRVKKQIVESGAIERCMGLAEQYCQKTRLSLRHARQSVYKQSLLNLTAYCVHRNG